MTTVITLPPSSINVCALRKEAEKCMEKGAFGYYASGATDETTLRENTAAFERLHIVKPGQPNANGTVSVHTDGTDERTDTLSVDTTGSILGYSTSFPLGIAPCAFHKLADHEYGEINTAKGITKNNVSVCWSTFGTCSIYDVCETVYADRPKSMLSSSSSTEASIAYEPPCMFQLYWLKDRDLTKGLIAHAAAAGCKAIVLTVDRPVLGKREIDLRAKFDLPPGMECPNVMNGKKRQPDYRHYWETVRGVPLTQRKEEEKGKDKEGTKDGEKSVTDFEGSFYLTAQVEDTLTWHNLTDLREMIQESCDGLNTYYREKYNQENSTFTPASPMAIILKGIMTYEDGYAAVVYGSDAVWVSNHGGRQLDTVLSGLDALPEVVAGVRAAEADIRSGNLANLPYKGLMTKGIGEREEGEGIGLLPSGRLRTEVYVDGGVSTGADVFKCVALGADHVFLARPVLWALAVGGDTLVGEYIDQIRKELRYIMNQCGITKLEDITIEFLTENRKIINQYILGQNSKG